MHVSYLVSVSTRFGPSRLRIGRVVPDSAEFLNPASDHTTLILELGRRNTRGYRKFRFENSWIGQPDCRSIIAQGWERSERAGARNFGEASSVFK